MSKPKKTRHEILGALIQRHQENSSRIGEIADLCSTEQRERTPEEDTEYQTLVRENSIIGMKIEAMKNPTVPTVSDPDTVLRESIANRQLVTVMMCRDLMTTADVAGTGIIPIQQQEMLKPLRAGLIYAKVGLTIRTGLRGGTLRWPRYGKTTAKWVKEGERLSDSSIDFTKLECTPERLGCAIPVTREELNDSEGIVESVVREEMPASIIDLVNEALFTTVGTYTDASDGNKTKNKAVVGPFVKAAETPFEFANEVPTRKELLKMKAKVLKTGLKFVAPCWVMTEDMKAELEDVKVDSGSGRFICENDHILGYPVFTTASIGDGNIGFGDWAYQASGFFDSMNLIVDPLTLARQNSVDFVLNARFATVTLYQEAFVVGHKKVTQAAGGGGGTQQGG